MNADPSYRIRREAEAAKSLAEMLRAEGHGDDVEMIADSIEGETGLHEALAAGLAMIDDLDVLDLGLSAKIEAFTDRRAAIRKRAEFIRAGIEQAMTMADLPKIALPSATLFLSARKPGVIVQNEADLPSEFFVVPDPAPKLDRKALAAALNAGREVPGACLDNGTVSLSIRRK